MLIMPRPEIHKGEKTRRKIVQAAIRLAASHGFGEMSFQMIADELGVSQSAVLYHFTSKNALFGELVRTIIRHNHETVSELSDITDDAGRRLLKHCLGNVMWALRYKRQDAQILILLYYMACHVKNSTALFSQMINIGRERLTALLLAGRREGLFQLKEDPAVVAEILQDSLFGAMLYATSAPEGSLDQAALEAKWRKVVASFTGWTDPRSGPILPAQPPAGGAGKKPAK